MNVPFPGMDPYLEHPVLWTSVHSRLMVWLAHQLGPLLRPRYVASVEERVFIEQPDQQRIPDLWIQKVRDERGGTTAAAAAVDTPLILEVEPLEVREHYIEILDRYRDLKVVTVIEVISPSNKVAGPGRDAYLDKQRKTLRSECHLVEIDLLRKGRHALSAPKLQVRARASYDYLVCVNRWPERKRFEVYPCRLRDRLPRVRVPLVQPDPDVPLDIQAAVEQVYEDGSYMLRVRYDEPCEPPLSPKAQAWANERWTAYRAAHPELFAEGAG
jgi:hypothetical protein